MSFYLCIGLKNPNFDAKDIIYDEVTSRPIGKSCIGGKIGARAFLLKIIYHDSIIRFTKEEVNLFFSKLKLFVSNTRSFYILLHWFKGNINIENIYIKKNVKIIFNDFINIFPNLIEDTRYIIIL